MADDKTLKNPKKYVCELCAFTSSNKKDFNKHLSTDKHKTHINADKCVQITPEICDKFACVCGKSYKHRQSLFRHQEKCQYNPEKTQNSSGMSAEFITEFMLKQQEANNEFMKKQQEANAAMMKDAVVSVVKEMAPNLGNNNTTNSNNTNQFNINVFLNEDCKQAINMSDFIKSIEVSLEQLDLTKTKGLEKGITKVIMDNMNKLSIYERPLHCTDTKRETLYIKDNDKWEKDNDRTKIKEIIKKTQNKNYTALTNWTKENPKFMNDDAKQMYYAKAMSQVGKSIDGVDEKIIKQVCKQTYVKDDLNMIE